MSFFKLKSQNGQSPLLVGFVQCSESRKSTIERQEVVNAATDLKRTSADTYTGTGRDILSLRIPPVKPATTSRSLFVQLQIKPSIRRSLNTHGLLRYQIESLRIRHHRFQQTVVDASTHYDLISNWDQVAHRSCVFFTSTGFLAAQVTTPLSYSLNLNYSSG